jgi:hypothetical protein
MSKSRQRPKKRRRTLNKWTAPLGNAQSVLEHSKPSGRERITLQHIEHCPEV